MGDPSAAERAYLRLRRDILAGTIPNGTLDIRRMGDRLRMSVTPVREALARLNAERLVQFAPNHGYTLTTPSAARLQSMYALSADLTDAALARVRSHRPAPLSDDGRTMAHHTYAESVSSVLHAIAAGQPNLELAEHLSALTDRLLAARRCEPQIFAQTDRESADLRAKWTARVFPDLRRTLRVHFRQRMERADVLASLLAEHAGDP